MYIIRRQGRVLKFVKDRHWWTEANNNRNNFTQPPFVDGPPGSSEPCMIRHWARRDTQGATMFYKLVHGVTRCYELQVIIGTNYHKVLHGAIRMCYKVLQCIIRCYKM